MDVVAWRAMLLLMALALLPFNVEMKLAEYGGVGDLQHRISYFPFDIPLLLLTFLSVPPILRTPRGSARRFLLISAAFLALVAVALAFNPSPRGFQVLIRTVVNVVVPVVTWITLPSSWQRRAVLVLVGSAALQSVVAVAQVVRGEPLGLTLLGEHSWLDVFADVSAAKGTFVHRHVLAAFALLAYGAATISYLGSRARVWLLALAIVVIPIGITYSRMAALGVIAVAGVLIIAWFRERKEVFPVLVALIVGVGIPGLLTLDSWIGRAEPIAAESFGDAITNNRVTLAKQALDLIADAPIVGVGPGLYNLELEEQLGADEGEQVLPVHLVPLLVAAETGIPAGVFILVVMGGLGWAAGRRGTARVAVYVAYLPFLIFDHFPYDDFQGLTMTGIWMALILVPFDNERRRAISEL